MKSLHINAKDLNLLPVLHALLEERNVSRAAKRLGLTQSAVSHALQRLRGELGDDLFVRGAKGVVPTPYALAVRGQIEPLMAALGQLYERRDAFSPATASGRLTIATTDYIDVVLMPKVLAVVRAEAPGLTVSSRPLAGELPKAALEAGDVDIAVAGYFGELPEGFYQQKLQHDEFCSAVRQGHPSLSRAAGGKGKALTLEAFAALEHVLISPRGDFQSAVDKELAKKGLTRRVVFGTSSFLAPAWMVAESDMVVTGLSRLLACYARHFALELVPAVVKVPGIQVIQVWHERTHRNPLRQWFRGVVRQCAVG